MTPYSLLSAALRQEEMTKALAEYARQQALGLQLNMARGKPSLEQLALSQPMLTCVDESTPMALPANMDLRNYGLLYGTEDCRKLMAPLLDAPWEQVLVGGSSSLQMMYDALSRAMLLGLYHSPQPWCKEQGRKWLCPTPGYDRHFAIVEQLGFTLIPVPMTGTGPDMDKVEALVQDPAVKGMWCVPKYSNPQGITYSDETVERLAAMKTAAPDFCLMWDNAYGMHPLDPANEQMLQNILTTCAEAGNPHRPLVFASTSKITFPGAGVAAMAASPEVLALTAKQLGVATIGYDKINMERHVRFLKNEQGLRTQMKAHAALLRPKFDSVLEILQERLAPLDLGSWQIPQGGYFICYEGPIGTAKRVVELCRQAGVLLTDAGATHPYGNDPQDSAIRLAPSTPPLNELMQAMDVFCICVRIAALEKLQ